MITNKLRILVLKQLAMGESSGYDLVKRIHAATGWKPSYGSIYPLLEQLRTESLATVKEEGKSKIYSLTQKGRGELHLFTEHHDAMIAQVAEWQKVMAHLCGEDHDPFFEHLTSSLQQGVMPFKEVVKHGYAFRAELTRLSKEGLLKGHKREVVAIIEEATAKMRMITRKRGKRT